MSENEKIKEFPKPGSKKAQAWKLFKEGKKPKDIHQEGNIGVTKGTLSSWYNMYKKLQQ